MRLPALPRWRFEAPLRRLSARRSLAGRCQRVAVDPRDCGCWIALNARPGLDLRESTNHGSPAHARHAATTHPGAPSARPGPSRQSKGPWRAGAGRRRQDGTRQRLIPSQPRGARWVSSTRSIRAGGRSSTAAITSSSSRNSAAALAGRVPPAQRRRPLHAHRQSRDGLGRWPTSLWYRDGSRTRGPRARAVSGFRREGYELVGDSYPIVAAR